MKAVSNVLRLVPGVIVLFVIGLLGRYIGEHIPYVSYLIVCIIIGLMISNTFGLPSVLEKGIQETHKVWLETGIMILGARVILIELLEVGPSLLTVIVLSLLLYILFTQFLSGKFNLEPQFGSVLASGLGVCGVSAATATGGALQIRAKDLAYIIGVILVIDVVTVLVWPIIGAIFSVPDEVFGPWAGVSMLSTGTTVAAGFAHSDKAGELATIIKMARNATIGIWALVFAAYYANKGITQNVTNRLTYFWDKFPKFVLGFIVVMLLANVGVLSEEQINSMENAYGWLFMMAFVGLGYQIKLKELKQTGVKPLLIALASVALVSGFSIVVLYFMFG